MVSLEDYKGTPLIKGFVQHLGGGDFYLIEKSLKDSFEKGVLDEQWFCRAYAELDFLMKASGDPTNGGKLVPTIITNKKGVRTKVYKARNEIKHEEGEQHLGEGHVVTYGKGKKGTIRKNRGWTSRKEGAGHRYTVEDHETGKTKGVFSHQMHDFHGHEDEYHGEKNKKPKEQKEPTAEFDAAQNINTGFPEAFQKDKKMLFNSYNDQEKELHREKGAIVEKSMKEAFQKSRYASRTSFYGLEKILEDGRFKSQFETNTSFGLLDHDQRAQIEKEKMGYGEDPEEGVENRPIYGYVVGEGENLLGTGDQYGNVSIEIKKEKALKNGTFCHGDSLMDGFGLVTSPLSDPSSLSMLIGDFERTVNKKGGEYKPFSGGIYTEVQYHKQLTVDDIEAVHIQKGHHNDDEEEAERLIKKLKGAGIKVSYRKVGDDEG
jgi:hypothetical protein